MIHAIAMLGFVLSGCTESEIPVPHAPETGTQTRSVPLGYDSTNWMGRLPDSTPITAISIPGTHDSATFGVSGMDAPDISRCQNTDATFARQLTDGIRFFDLRVGSDGKLHHGLVVCYDSYSSDPIMINEVFDRIITFLDSHPTETALVLVKHEYGDSTDEYLTHVRSAVNNHGSRVYTGTSKDVTLSQVRGKIILLDGGRNLSMGIDMGGMHGGGMSEWNGIRWQNFWDIGDWTQSVGKRAELKAAKIKEFNKWVADANDDSLFCFNWWNKAWNFGTSVKHYAGLVESHFYGKWDGNNRLYYPNGVQIMDYYNPDLVHEVIESNWNN